MIESVLFKSIDFVGPYGVRTGDVLVEKGKIKQVGWDLPVHAEVVVSEPGLVLMPGVIDPHVHFRTPGLEWKETIETGSRAAASGGVTTFFDMPNTVPPAITQAAIQHKKDMAAATSLIHYNFFIAATADNIDDCLAVENVPGIKLFMGSTTGQLLLDDYDAQTRLFATGQRLIAVHAEDQPMIDAMAAQIPHPTAHDHPRIRSVAAALKATKRVVALAKRYHRRVHICHLTTQEEAMFLEESATPGLISTEVCPQHLFLWAPDVYDKMGTWAKINPPIRDKRHADALWRALKNGIISCVGTDHAPHTQDEKSHPYPDAHAGMPGVETSLPLFLHAVNQNRCQLVDVCRWLCQGPADTFGVVGKGRIDEGFDADLVLIDLKAKRVLRHRQMHTQCRWTPFDGMSVIGAPIATYVSGQLVYREGDFFDTYKGQEVRLAPPWETV